MSNMFHGLRRHPWLIKWQYTMSTNIAYDDPELVLVGGMSEFS